MEKVVYILPDGSEESVSTEDLVLMSYAYVFLRYQFCKYMEHLRGMMGGPYCGCFSLGEGYKSSYLGHFLEEWTDQDFDMQSLAALENEGITQAAMHYTVRSLLKDATNYPKDAQMYVNVNPLEKKGRIRQYMSQLVANDPRYVLSLLRQVHLGSFCTCDAPYDGDYMDILSYYEDVVAIDFLDGEEFYDFE